MCRQPLVRQQVLERERKSEREREREKSLYKKNGTRVVVVRIRFESGFLKRLWSGLLNNQNRPVVL